MKGKSTRKELRQRQRRGGTDVEGRRTGREGSHDNGRRRMLQEDQTRRRKRRQREKRENG